MATFDNSRAGNLASSAGIGVFTPGTGASPTPQLAEAALTNKEVRGVIFASSLGTVFEWYDFCLYGSLAAIISKQFF